MGGVTVKNNEIADLVLDDIKSIFEKVDIDVSDDVVDRAHRIDQGKDVT